jgi:hypothetical protein
MRAPKGDFAWNVARIAAAGNAHIWPPAGLSLARILAHVAHLPDDAVELTRSRDALVVLNQPLRYVAPLRRMQGITFRGADKLPEWRSRLDQPLVEGRGGGIARLAWPVG